MIPPQEPKPKTTEKLSKEDHINAIRENIQKINAIFEDKDDTLFKCCQNKDLTALIEKAQQAVLIAAPCIDTDVAKALIVCRNRLGQDKVWAIIDPDPNVVRLGYGNLDGMKLLHDGDVNVHVARGLRIKFLRVDDTALLVTPLSAILEQNENRVTNAVSISTDEASRIIKALFPDALKIFSPKMLVQSEAKSELTSNALTEFEVKRAEQDLKKNPPIAPDLARKLRVLNSRFQFVELKFKGSKPSQRKLSLEAADLGVDPTEFKNLGGTWKVLEADDEMSKEISALEAELKTVRDNYLIPLKGFGHVILGERRPEFDNEMDSFKKKVTSTCSQMNEKVSQQLKSSCERLKGLLVENFSKRIPPNIQKLNLPSDLQKKQIENTVKSTLEKRFPKAEAVIGAIEVDWTIYNISEQIMSKAGFAESVKKAFSLDLEDLVNAEYAVSIKGTTE